MSTYFVKEIETFSLFVSIQSGSSLRKGSRMYLGCGHKMFIMCVYNETFI